MRRRRGSSSSPGSVRSATLRDVSLASFRPYLLLAALALLLGACGPRYQRVETFDEYGLRVVLRSEKRGGETVPRGYAHPVTIASVRLAHILARLDVRMGPEDEDEGKSERVPAFPTVMLYTVGEQLAQALAKATPDQEVVVQAVRKEKSLVIFDQELLTSFVAYVKGEDLVLHLSRVEWKVPKSNGGQGSLEEDLPEPFAGRRVQDFKVLPADGIVPIGEQAVSVAWRDPVFREPTHVRVGEGGRLLRRSVLMESAPQLGPEEEAGAAALPADLPAETLRALADLQEQRSAGEISETAYHQKRRDLLRQAEDLRRSQGTAPAP